jgi:hypothetical protein
MQKSSTTVWIHRVTAAAVVFLLANLALLTGCGGVSSGSSNQSQTSTLSSTASYLNFGNVSAGNSKTLAINVSNSGSASITVSSFAVSTQYFSLASPSLPATITAGQSLSLNVTFTPDVAGNFNATASIGSNASNPVILSLMGTATGGTTGTQEGTLTSNPATETFPSTTVGSTQPETITLTNTGNASLDITQAAISGAGFQLSGITTPITLTASQSTTFTVTFSPQNTGSATGTVTITSDGSNPSLAIGLSGTGTQAPTYSVNLSWAASTSSNISGYNVYRAAYASSCGSFAKINPALNTGTLYTDTVVKDGSSYCYATTAVNTSNEESGYSNVVSNVQIPAP